MLNKVIVSIAQKLNQVFGDNYQTYIDTVEQGLYGPCFLITCLQANQKQLVGNLYVREQSFDILYFPQSDNGITSEVNEVASSLLMGLEYIEVDSDLLRGTKMSHKVVDDVLHFLVNYDIRIRKVVEPDPLMGDLTITERVKADDN